MNHGSLFSGIGGFDLAAQWMGWENVFHCEINPFGQKVLKYYWPNAISYDDITKTDFTVYRGRIDILTGGFPCQPFSVAGKRKGTEDARNLWPEYYRAIREIQPAWVVGENVPGLINWSGGLVFEQVQADLEAEGYEVWPVILPACSVGATHKRDRIWFIAYSESRKSGRLRNEITEERSRCGNELFGECSGISCDERPTPDATGNGLHDKSTEAYNSIRQNNQQSGSQRFSTIKGLGNERPTPDTDSDGHELRRFGEDRSVENESEGEGNQRQRIWSDDRGTCEQRTAPDTDLQRQQECNNAGQPEQKKWFDSNFSSHQNWSNFPTQPPVRHGDDGLSSRLDGITFSKWRNESIKAGGNAIVPQVVYQIFKSIEQFTALAKH